MLLQLIRRHSRASSSGGSRSWRASSLLYELPLMLESPSRSDGGPAAQPVRPSVSSWAVDLPDIPETVRAK